MRKKNATVTNGKSSSVSLTVVILIALASYTFGKHLGKEMGRHEVLRSPAYREMLQEHQRLAPTPDADAQHDAD